MIKGCRTNGYLTFGVKSNQFEEKTSDFLHFVVYERSMIQEHNKKIDPEL